MTSAKKFTSRALALAFSSLMCAGCDCQDGRLFELVPLAAVQIELDFGPVAVGAFAEATIVVASQGTAALSVDALAIDGAQAFSLVEGAPTRVEVGAELPLKLRFAPADVGALAAVLHVDTDAANGPRFDVQLRGEGVRPECPPDEICRRFAFDPSIGICVSEDLDGPCNDESACTEDDRCVLGACLGVAVECPLLGACGRGVCDAELGCFNVPDASLCSDAEACTVESCDLAGTCSSIALDEGARCGESPCREGTCRDAVCTFEIVADGTVCDDGLLCTANDACSGGVCAGASSTAAPTVGGAANAFGVDRFAEFVMPDPAGLPDEVLAFNVVQRDDTTGLPLGAELRGVTRVRNNGGALNVVTAGAADGRAPTAIGRTAAGFAGVALDESGGTFVTTYAIVGDELVQVGELALLGIGGFATDGDARAFVHVPGGLRAISLDNPAEPVISASFTDDDFDLALLAVGDRLFWGRDGGLTVLDTASGSLAAIGGDSDGPALAFALADVGVLALRATTSGAGIGERVDVLDPVTGAVTASLDVEGRDVTGLAAHGARLALFGRELELIALPEGALLDATPWGAFVLAPFTSPELSATTLWAHTSGSGGDAVFDTRDDTLLPVTGPAHGAVGQLARVAPGLLLAGTKVSARIVDVASSPPTFAFGGMHGLNAAVHAFAGALVPAPATLPGALGTTFGPFGIVDATPVTAGVAPALTSARNLAAVESGRFVTVRGNIAVTISARQPGFACDIDCGGSGGRIVVETFDLSTPSPLPHPRLGAAVLPVGAGLFGFLDLTMSVDAARTKLVGVVSAAEGDFIVVADVSQADAPRILEPTSTAGNIYSRFAIDGNRLFGANFAALDVFTIGNDALTLDTSIPWDDLLPGVLPPGSIDNGPPVPLHADATVLVLGAPGSVIFVDVSGPAPAFVAAVAVPLHPLSAAADGGNLIVGSRSAVAVLTPACPPLP